VKDDRHARHRRADTDRRRRPGDGFRTRDRQRFSRLVEDALAGLPDAVLEHIGGATLVIVDLPPEGSATVHGPPLVHLDGTRSTSVTGRGTITQLRVHRRPVEARASSRADLAEVVRDAVVLAVAERLGWDDDQLDALGGD
jgi:predicted Zn-dependent protease with MMP-like domain